MEKNLLHGRQQGHIKTYDLNEIFIKIYLIDIMCFA